MSQLIELKVPDIGGHSNVNVIDVAVKTGDTINIDDTLVTLETDKATMDVPAETAGIIKEIKVTTESKVSEGDVLVLVETNHQTAKPANQNISTNSMKPKPEAEAAPLSTSLNNTEVTYDMLVLGGGPGGYSAAFRAADLGLRTVIIERYPTLGGVCLNVGCIPSKALLHNAAVIDEVRHLTQNGIKYPEPEIDINGLRDYKEKVIHKLTSGLSGIARSRKVDIIRGIGTFVDPHHMEIFLTEKTGKKKTGKKQTIQFKQAIIAAGSSAVKLPFIPDDPRIVDSTGALKLKDIPKKMLIIGGGIIGLEMGTVYSTLGTRLDVVEMMDGLMQGADRDLVKVWQKYNEHRFDNIMLNTKTVAVESKEDGIWVSFEGINAPKEPQQYDLVLVAAGRAPNGLTIGANKAGVAVSEKGFIQVNKQQKTNIPHIFAIGDIVGQPMLAHKAVHEGHVAAEVAAGKKTFFDARAIPGVAYTDPEVAWVGITEEVAKKEGLEIEKSIFPWAASGRAIANGREEGFTKLIFNKQTHQIIGGAIVGTNAGDMIGEICLAIEMGCDATDIGKTIHPHPTLGESIGMTAEVFEGVCTDLPPQKK